MIEDGLRLIKRFALLLPGIGLTYLVVEDVYTIFDERLPAYIAVLVTYIISAYVLIPALIRLIRIIFKPNHVPHYSTTPDGFASDPVNIALFGTREQVIAAMSRIGWHMADRRTPRSLFRLVLSIVLRRPYSNAPFSTLYLLGKSQDLGFQLPVGSAAHHRHHVRFWAVRPGTAERFKEHVAFWKSHHPDPEELDDKYLWLGCASLDIGIGIIRHNAQFTHMIHHDTAAERKLIARSLKEAGQSKKVRTVRIGAPYRLTNRVISGYFNSDGKLTIIEL